MNLKQYICKALDCCAPFRQIETDYAYTKTRLEDARRELETLKETNEATITILKATEEERESLEDELQALEHEVDVFAKSKWPQVPNKAYTNKRGGEYDTSINEWIQPRSYAVLHLLRHHYPYQYANKYNEVKALGTRIAQAIRWTSDSNLHNSVDYYQSPAETLSSGKGDCEDHAFVLASALPKTVGVAYGFYSNGVGHAFNVFVFNEELWIADTVTSECVIHRYNSTGHGYTIHFIITPEHTYMLKPTVEFGRLAGWLPEVKA